MTEIVAIIDYGSGNLKSAEKALARAARESNHTATILVTNDPDQIIKADRIVLPGVGAFADCRAGLMAISGLSQALNEQVIDRGRPFLGICVGMQLMARTGLEKGSHQGLGWLDAQVERVTPADKDLKIPHMGWNIIQIVNEHALFDGIDTGPEGAHAYFVHSYHMKVQNSVDLIATTDYGGPITACVGRDNMIGTQFHPEKSQNFGQQFLSNFLGWKP